MNYKKRYQKWENIAKGYKIDNSKLATFELTVQNTLKLLGNKKEGLSLDIGCGNGLIDIILAKRTNFQIVGCDISDTILEKARKNIKKMDLEKRIRVEKGDVYKLNYPSNYFDVVLSFGYSSAAGHKGAQKEVYRVLKPGGILILDFVNHLSLYKLFRFSKNFIRFKVYKSGKTKYYHFGKLGIREYFQKTGFFFVSKIYFNTYPPIFKKFISVKTYVLFENTIGKLFRKILGRVILVYFQK